MLHFKGSNYYDCNDWFYGKLIEILDNKLQGAIFAFSDEKIISVLGQELNDIPIGKGFTNQLQEQKKFQAIVKKLSKDATDAGYTFMIKYPSFDLMYDAGTKEAFLDVSKVDLQIAKIMYKG